MQTIKRFGLALVPLAMVLPACSGSGGSSPGAIASFVLEDPIPGAANLFGSQVTLLPNGNIVVLAPGDSSVGLDNGAVHLFNPTTQTVLASFYGDSAGDGTDSFAVIALANGNFVISAPNDDVGGILDAGSVVLVDGATGTQIGTTLAGDNMGDHLGNSGITPVANNNFVVASATDDVGGIFDAGSVMLINGATGMPIGASIAGETMVDLVGLGSVTLLANDNFVVVSKFDNEGGVADAGSVKLVDGTTGAVISTAAGDTENDRLGTFITALANGNYVIATFTDDVGGIVDAGSVAIMNGATGAEIASMAGDVAEDQLGFGFPVTELANGNLVISSPFDDEGGIVDAGSVRLVNGSTGAEIGSLAGDVEGDRLGGNITLLANNHFVIASISDDEGGIVDAGSVRLVNGMTGAEINFLAGDDPDDRLGSGVFALANGNYVIWTFSDNAPGIASAGSLKLMDGATGTPILDLVGDDPGDFSPTVTVAPLANGNFVFAASSATEGGNMQAGAVRVINGTTGAQIGSTLIGEHEFDALGSGGITILANNNFVVSSQFDWVGGVARAGSVMLVNGTTGIPIGSPIVGAVEDDFLGNLGITALSPNTVVIASSSVDEGSVVDAGSIIHMDGVTGATIGTKLIGGVSEDFFSAQILGSPNADFFLVMAPLADHNGVVDSGLVRLVTQ